MLRILFTLLLLISSAKARQTDVFRVLPDNKPSDDARLKPPKDLNGFFPLQTPATRADWEERAQKLRQQVLVATGLYPLPARTPLNAVVHGKATRPGFTVEKFYFESLSGHFVSGLLFRPDSPLTTKRPAILCPHGHGGRMQDYGESKMEELIASGAEVHRKSGRFPKLARCAQLARMGCVAVTFDMLGFVDSQQIPHAVAHRYAKVRAELEGRTDYGFFSAKAESRLHSIMGLQTWNCLRALDFMAQLPDVDPQRMGVTGGSGGGTQTIVLGAIDKRPIVSFPNGMVSTSMQGGCTCENCSLLRIDTGNVELAALFAPRPMGMTAADDWTRDMMTSGFPQLKKVYSLYDAESKVMCEPLLHFPHNYNAVTRSIMYEWMNEHLHLQQQSPITETEWEPLTPDEYTVWNAEHPAPASGVDYERRLLKQLNERDRKTMFDHQPVDDDQLQTYLKITANGWKAVIGREIPASSEVHRTKVRKNQRPGYTVFGDLISRADAQEKIPVVSLYPNDTEWNSETVVWLDGFGKSALFQGEELHPEAARLVKAGFAIVTADLIGQGEHTKDGKTWTTNRTVRNPRPFAGYTYCYNHTLCAARIHDIQTIIGWIQSDQHASRKIHAIGTNGAEPWVAIARIFCDDRLTSTSLQNADFRFDHLNDWKDTDFLPGAVKYGDLPAVLAQSTSTLWLGTQAVPKIVSHAFQAADAKDNLKVRPELQLSTIIDHLLQP